MNIVIQCAARKDAAAGTLRTVAGTPIRFVAQPDLAPPSEDHVYAKPDDASDDGRPWRARLADYNAARHANPLNLLQAWRLYRPSEYGELVERFGLGHVFILSAGWGLIRADFLTPYYDITFSGGADAYKRRGQHDHYVDFRMLPLSERDPIVFIGGKDYVPLFCSLTEGTRAARTVFFNSATPPVAPGCVVRRFRTARQTNWHYDCARALIADRIAAT